MNASRSNLKMSECFMKKSHLSASGRGLTGVEELILRECCYKTMILM